MTDSGNKKGVIFFPLKPASSDESGIISRSIMKYISSRIESSDRIAASFIYMVLRDDSGSLKLYVPDNIGTEELAADYYGKAGQNSDCAIFGQMEDAGEDLKIKLSIYDYASKKSSVFLDRQVTRHKLSEAAAVMAKAIIEALDPGKNIFDENIIKSITKPETHNNEAFSGYMTCLDIIAGRDPYKAPPDSIAAAAKRSFEADPLFSGPIDVLSYLADDYSRFGMKKEAADLLSDSLKVSRNPRILLALGKIRLACQEIPAAFDSLREALTIKPDMSDVAYNMGQLAMELGRPDDAKFAYKAMIESGSGLPIAYDNLGVILAQSGDLEGATDCWHKAIEFDPGKASAYCNLGRAFIEKGDNKKAGEYLKKAISANPNFFMAYMNMAELYKRTGEPEKAKNSMEKAVRLNPDIAFTRDLREKLQKANILIDSDSEKEAIRIYDEILGEFELCWQAWFFRGIALRKLKRFDEAESSFLKSSGINNKFPDSQNELGVIYLMRKKTDEALMLFENAVKISPNHVGFLCNLSLCLIEMGKFEEARGNLSKAKFLSPNDKNIDELFAALAARSEGGSKSDAGPAGDTAAKDKKNEPPEKGSIFGKIRNIFKK